MRIDDMTQAEQEAHFREGAYYGFLQACIAVRDGASLQDLEELLDKAAAGGKESGPAREVIAGLRNWGNPNGMRRTNRRDSIMSRTA